MRNSRGKVALAVAATATTFVLAGCGAGDKNIVDEKVELTVPDTDVRCYFLEVEIQSAMDGEEVGETSYCAEKAEWDANRVGAEWKAANGAKK